MVIKLPTEYRYERNSMGRFTGVGNHPRGMLGKSYKKSEDAKRRISDAHKKSGHKPSREALLKSKSPEALKKFSISMRGRKFSQEHKQKLSLAKKGKPGRKLSLETRLKLSESKKGIKNPMFVNGNSRKIDKQIRHSFEYKEWRKSVFERDNYTCQGCGVRGGVTLNADHIQAFSMILKKYDIDSLQKALICQDLWNIKNGRTLCVACHKKTGTFGGKIFSKQIKILL